MPDVEFPLGKFGENLTTSGLLETDVFIGDEFQMGTAIVKVTQPRLPCYKLGIKFGRRDVIKTFVQSGFSGIYFSVIEEGELGVGDEIKYLRSDEFSISVSDVANLFNGKRARDREFIELCLKSQLADQMKRFISNA
jgi:MOSC domain-containing protein YiiM